MGYEDEEEIEERGFRINDDGENEPLGVPEEIDFGLDEEDPDKDR